ncbi:MAG: hypothetical protein JWO41_274 [Candidatus Saccharibacteria bacterium]|nr:hypothetical protein [Candidatus Saccharibacteria bacterium]
MKQLLTFAKKPYVLFIAGLLLGALVILGVRFFSYAPEHVHYHANWAVYLNGTRDEFKAPQYYQEVNICSADGGITIPQQRAHMHDEINSVVHVHDHAVTWGQFFDNLGWSVTNDLIETDDGTVYRNDDTNKVNIWINGQDYTGLGSIADRVIKDEDRLLISYGPSDQTVLTKEFASVPKTAHHYDVTKDPASCSAGEAVTTKDRLKHLL